MKSLAILGHRPESLGGYENNSFQDWVRDKIADALYRAKEKGYERVISGASQGIGFIAIEEAVSQEYNVFVLLLFRGTQVKWPDWVQDEFDRLLDMADEVEYMSQGGYNAKMFFVRDQHMINMADAVVIVWDGAKVGEVYEAFRTAQEIGKPIYWINTQEKSVGWVQPPSVGAD